MPSRLTRSDLKLERTAFELRYDTAFALWDHAGAIGIGIQQKWPEAKLVEAIPTKINFSWRRQFEFQVEMEKALILGHHQPHNLKDFADAAEDFHAILRKTLNVPIYTRVGLRIIHVKDFKTIADATKAILALNQVNVPAGKFFGQAGEPKSVEVSYRWENKSNGLMVRIRSEGIVVQFSPPPSIPEIEPLMKETQRLLFDLDYYTVAPVTPSQLNVVDWVNNIVHMTNRDTKVFLEA